MTKKEALQQLDMLTKSANELRGKIATMEEPGKITDRVKTFEDACEEIGEFPMDEKFISGTPDEIAYKKLKVVSEALNEGVILSYANPDQKKWYPWFLYGGSGFRFGGTDCDNSCTHTAGGSRLCYATSELAKYAGTQFIDLYNQLLK